ncbi:MAG TPA: ligase-associated DNA damage response endonuclease PdeM [Bacteroidia bacterium]|jgi:DNA ligase-associated metallophosphoesterase|nr:ligase-associated DNA damage response endonuclease PdeM [Bacteroidia bacterium]
MQLQLGKHSYHLLNEKALFRASDKTLIIADLHLGKAQHFRKHGIYVPQQSAERDYERLTELIQSVEPKRIILLGDLFHSTLNHEWIMFCDVVNMHKKIEFILILGNHDILKEEHYTQVCLQVKRGFLEEEDIIFSHHPLKKIPKNKFCIAGHIHPGVVLHGKGRQSIKLPCFHLSQNQLILPAFGSLTGLQIIAPGKEDGVFVVTTNIVMEV